MAHPGQQEDEWMDMGQSQEGKGFNVGPAAAVFFWWASVASTAGPMDERNSRGALSSSRTMLIPKGFGR